jgi:undecaprenyl-phosphate 4-deoxy-4-formamido-L-arabinose transferase
MLVSVCIPCYRSAKTLPFVAGEIREVFAAREDYDYQLILVNDGSPDDTYGVIERLCAEDPKIVGVDLSRNYGQQAAKMAALDYAEGDVIVYMDDDGQHPAAGIFPLVEKLAEGYDIVYARFPQKHHSGFKRITSRLYQKVSEWVGNKPKGLSVSSFTAWSRATADAARRYHSPFPAPGLFLNHVTSRIANVDMEHRDRVAGESTYSFRKLIGLTVTALTNFSIIPLRLASYTGVLCALVGFLGGIFVIIRKLVHPAISAGYSSTIAVILFVGGVLMLILGILGEYVGRIYMTVSDMPQYHVRRAINAPEAGADSRRQAI